jgi:hypothetical protein
MTSRPTFDDQLTDPRRIFILLILYRWISLIPPLVLLAVLLVAGEEWRPSVVALGLAVSLNLLISLYHRPLNRDVTRFPWLLAIDLILVAVVVALSGRWRTPYYLYALSPLLASAFFFQLRGAMIFTIK